MDLISELPREIKHHIIYILGTDEAPRIRFLSKLWKASWNSRPVLDFDDYSFSRKSDFFDHLDQSLQSFSLSRQESVETLSMTISGQLSQPGDVIDRWVRLAATRNLKNLELRLINPNDYKLDLPSSKTLTYLTLQGFGLKRNNHRLEFPSLKGLQLDCVALEDPGLLQELISAGPRLEYFTLHSHEATASLELSHPRLKRFEVKLSQEFYKIAIRAPSLVSFICHGLDLGIVPDIKLEACELTLEELTLMFFGFTSEWIEAQVSRMSSLKVLTVMCLNNLTSLKISSPVLTELRLRSCAYIEEAKIYAPSLIAIECSGNKFPFYPLVTTPPSLQMSQFHFLLEAETMETAWFDSLRELFDKLYRVNNMVVCIIARSAEIAIVNEGLAGDSMFRIIQGLHNLYDVEVFITSYTDWIYRFSIVDIKRIFTVSSFDRNNLAEYLSERLRIDIVNKRSYFDVGNSKYLSSFEMEALNDWTQFEGDDGTKLVLLKAYTGSAPFRLTKFALAWSCLTVHFCDRNLNSFSIL